MSSEEPSLAKYFVTFGRYTKRWFSFVISKDTHMTHVVTKPCDGCRYTDCVVVCPVECFYEGETILYIHPEECIDCEACVPECPVEAIFHEDDVPEEWQSYVELNAVQSPECENITERKEPLSDK